MTLLLEEFDQSSDFAGLQHFKQLKRTNNAAIYCRTRLDGRLYGYEVFIIYVAAANTVYSRSYEEREVYPGVNKFGKTAWFCSTLERAEARYQFLTS